MISGGDMRDDVAGGADQDALLEAFEEGGEARACAGSPGDRLELDGADQADIADVDDVRQALQRMQRILPVAAPSRRRG